MRMFGKEAPKRIIGWHRCKTIGTDAEGGIVECEGRLDCLRVLWLAVDIRVVQKVAAHRHCLVGLELRPCVGAQEVTNGVSGVEDSQSARGSPSEHDMLSFTQPKIQHRTPECRLRGSSSIRIT